MVGRPGSGLGRAPDGRETGGVQLPAGPGRGPGGRAGGPGTDRIWYERVESRETRSRS